MKDEAAARQPRTGVLKGYVGRGTSLTTEASFKGMLRVDGHLSGRITSPDGTLIVSTSGRLDADVEVAVAQINGAVNGRIVATRRVEVGRAARIKGIVVTPMLIVEPGAFFEGSCRMTSAKAAAPASEAAPESACAAGEFDAESFAERVLLAAYQQFIAGGPHGEAT